MDTDSQCVCDTASLSLDRRPCNSSNTAHVRGARQNERQDTTARELRKLRSDGCTLVCVCLFAYWWRPAPEPQGPCVRASAVSVSPRTSR